MRSADHLSIFACLPRVVATLLLTLWGVHGGVGLLSRVISFLDEARHLVSSALCACHCARLEFKVFSRTLYR